jgi:hypothetical protein
VLTGDNPINNQRMLGHVWWAEHCENLAFFSQVQTRFNTIKILALIEEANQPENRDQVYLAWLTRISPAEVIGYFSEVAFQIRHGEIMRLPGAHLSSLIPFPRNLFLVGTMDTVQFNWFDEYLLSQTTVIYWPETSSAFFPCHPLTTMITGNETEFLATCIRSERAGRSKLRCLSELRSIAVHPLTRVENLMRTHGVQLPGSVLEEVIVYFANSWSRDGSGLFDPSPSRNREIALDLATSQILLPHGWETIQRSGFLRSELRETLGDDCPYSQAFLDRLEMS